MTAWSRGFLIAACVATVGGCFPYRETYRPTITGMVVDESGAPVSGASIEACSSAWGLRLAEECPRRVTSTSAADGTFVVPHAREIEACCLGEAPLPQTLVSVCMPDGRMGGASMTGLPDPVKLTIPVSAPGSMSAANWSGKITPARGEASVQSRCAARAGELSPR